MEIERDTALRGWEVTEEGGIVAIGWMKRDDGSFCSVPLYKVVIPDDVLFAMGEKGILDRYVEG